MEKNNKAETAPEAPTELYQMSSLCLNKLMDEANIIDPKYNIRKITEGNFTKPAPASCPI